MILRLCLHPQGQNEDNIEVYNYGGTARPQIILRSAARVHCLARVMFYQSYLTSFQ